jgi:predicted phosphodiesterase
MTVITELTTDERLAELLSGVEQRRVVAGHTHMQLRRRVGERVFVNPGSVGRPYEAEPGAYWAILDGDAIELRRTDYDRERAAELVRGSGYPEAEELAIENVLKVPPRAEALAMFGG